MDNWLFHPTGFREGRAWERSHCDVWKQVSIFTCPRMTRPSSVLIFVMCHISITYHHNAFNYSQCVIDRTSRPGFMHMTQIYICYLDHVYRKVSLLVSRICNEYIYIFFHHSMLQLAARATDPFSWRAVPSSCWGSERDHWEWWGWGMCFKKKKIMQQAMRTILPALIDSSLLVWLEGVLQG